jgi:hypothetical protein
MSRKVMAAILAHREVAPLHSDKHFSINDTLIKAWASMKNFQPKAEGSPPDDAGSCGAGPGDLPTADTSAEHQPATPAAETEPMRWRRWCLDPGCRC